MTVAPSTLTRLRAEAAALWQVRADELATRCRERRLTAPRHAIRAVLRARGKSLSAIGRAEGRDHSSIAHSIAAAARLRAEDPVFAARLGRLGQLEGV